MWFHHLQAGIGPICQGSTSVGIPGSLSAILSANDLPIDSMPVALPPKDTPDEETVNHLKSNLKWTADPTMTKVDREVVGLENAAGKHVAK